MSSFNFLNQNNNNSNTNNLSLSENKFQIKSPIPKPDFSMINKKESSFSYKQNGSYKKQKDYVPESPMKSPGHKSFTPVQNSIDLVSTQVSRKRLDFSAMQNESHTSPIKEDNDEYDRSSFSIKNSNVIEFGKNLKSFNNFNNFNNLINNIEIGDEDQSCNILI